MADETTSKKYLDSSIVPLIKAKVEEKQDLLVDSGENQNIKTINGESILGSGDITVAGEGGKLYSEWGENTDGSLTQKFLNDYLNIAAPQVGLKGEKIASNTITFGNVLGTSSVGPNRSSVVIGDFRQDNNFGDRVTMIGNSWGNGTYAQQSVFVGLNGPAIIDDVIQETSPSFGQSSVGIGVINYSLGDTAVRIGWDLGTLIGETQVAEMGGGTGDSSVSIGDRSSAPKTNAVAIGPIAKCLADAAVAIGSKTTVDDATFGIAIGMGSHATRKGEFAIGVDPTDTTIIANNIGYNSTPYRLISGVYPGEEVNDAATYGQVKPLENKIKTIDNKTEVLVGLSVAAPNESTVTLDVNTGAVTSMSWRTDHYNLPVASATQAGVINAATFASIQDSAEKIESILNSSVAVNDLAADVSQEALTTAWKTATGKNELINGAKILDTANNKTWTYYSNSNTWVAQASGGEQVEINQFTNEAAGTIKGSATGDGKIFAEADGTGSVIGWDALNTTVNTHTTDLTSAREDIDANTVDIADLEANKQDKLVDTGEKQNIKTVNGQSILGTGDIAIAEPEAMTAEEFEAAWNAA